jgi:hypothetical protein
MTEVRAITPRCWGSRFPSCAIISSVMPSLKYSWLGSPVKFSKGRTASITRSGGACGRACCCRCHTSAAIRAISTSPGASSHSQRSLPAAGRPAGAAASCSGFAGNSSAAIAPGAASPSLTWRTSATRRYPLPGIVMMVPLSWAVSPRALRSRKMFWVRFDSST